MFIVTEYAALSKFHRLRLMVDLSAKVTHIGYNIYPNIIFSEATRTNGLKSRIKVRKVVKTHYVARQDYTTFLVT